MKIIGITGGVGAGKSTILDYLQEHYHCIILKADEVANLLKEPGQCCYLQIVDLLGKEILDADGHINRGKMADKIFGNDQLLKEVNDRIHPAVKNYILEAMKNAREEKYDYFFLEAALLIESGYEKLVDEMWYIYAKDEIRRARLRKDRGYTDEKIDHIMKAQLSDLEYRKHCKVLIDNSSEPEAAFVQIERELRG